MTSHFLGLEGAATLQTRYLLLTRKAIADVIAAEAMGAIVGPAGLGKTFAVSNAIARQELPIVRLTFESRPTIREQTHDSRADPRCDWSPTACSTSSRAPPESRDPVLDD